MRLAKCTRRQRHLIRAACISVVTCACPMLRYITLPIHHVSTMRWYFDRYELTPRSSVNPQRVSTRLSRANENVRLDVEGGADVPSRCVAVLSSQCTRNTSRPARVSRYMYIYMCVYSLKIESIWIYSFQWHMSFSRRHLKNRKQRKRNNGAEKKRKRKKTNINDC